MSATLWILVLLTYPTITSWQVGGNPVAIAGMYAKYEDCEAAKQFTLATGYTMLGYSQAPGYRTAVCAPANPKWTQVLDNSIR